MSRVFLYLIASTSLAWIVYATYDHTNKRNLFRAEYIFGTDDENIIIIQNTLQTTKILEQLTIENANIKNILKQLNWERIDKIYLSQTRGQMLIETHEVLTQSAVKNIFVEQTDLKVLSSKTIALQKIKGRYAKNKIYLYTRHFPINNEPWNDISFDKNSDAIILDFQQKRWNCTELYIKKNGTIEYRTQERKPFTGKTINDYELFAEIVPENTEIYKFYESDYLRSFDSAFVNSPLNNWIKYGLVHIVVNGQNALISDYVETIDPLNIIVNLYTLTINDNQEHVYIENSNFTNILPNSKGIFVYPINEFVVMSTDSLICEQIIADYKLGHTLAQNPHKTQEIYENLPQKVNFRKVSPIEKLSLSIYRKTNITTKVIPNNHNTPNSTIKENNAVVSYPVGEEIKDFYNKNDLLFVTTKYNKVVLFEDNKKLWEQNLNEKIVGTGSLIDIYGNNKTQLLLATEKKVFLFDKNGNQVQGFPIHLEETINVQDPICYRWKGNTFFILTTKNGKLILCDQQGRELSIIDTELKHISHTPIVWVSANKPFIGVFDDQYFEMIHAEDRKKYRKFPINKLHQVIKEPNEIKIIQIQGETLATVNQKGHTIWQLKIPKGQLIKTSTPSLGIILKQENNIQLINSNGITWASINLPFIDLNDVEIFITENGLTLVATLEPIENKIYLWKTNGELYRTAFNGSKIVRYNDGYIYTIVDNVIVKYKL